MEHFRKLGITEHVISAIRDEKFEKPSEIQEKATPLAMQGKDVIAKSATGSGKTLVFGAAVIQKTERGKGIQALVLTPTRELADQVAKEMRKFSKYKPLNVVMICGGLSINPQITDLRTADIVIGTPGRTLDHLQRGTINLGRVKILILDEADRMLDMGFIDDVENIIRMCPKDRQTMLFSATIPTDIAALASRYMRNPVKVAAEQYVDPLKLTQVYYDILEGLKFSLLVHLLKNERASLVMIFCNSRTTVDFVANNLKRAGISAQAIHGGFSQEQRNRAISSFHSKQVKVLVCTDVAARGLDIKGVTHVYNYDIPKEAKQYIHRIGRTARAGKEGKAISLLSYRDYDNFTRVLRENDVKIEKQERPYIQKITVSWSERPKRFGGFRGRGGHGRDSHDWNRRPRGRF